jgi:hypothetical protein
MQTAFGRRPVLLVSTMICLVSNIWRAVAKDYRSFMGACILNGIGAGVAEVCNKYLVVRVRLLTCTLDSSTHDHCRPDVLARERSIQHALFHYILWFLDGKYPIFSTGLFSHTDRLAQSLPAPLHYILVGVTSGGSTWPSSP